MRRQEAIKFPGIRVGERCWLNRLKRSQFVLSIIFVFAFLFLLYQFALCISKALCFLPLPRLQFSTKKFSRLLSNRKQYIGNKLSCQWVIAYVWFSHLIFSSPTMPLDFPQSMYVRVLSFSRCPFRNRISLLYPPLIPFLLLSFWWSFSFQNVFFASLLHPFAPSSYSPCSFFRVPWLWGDVWSLSAAESMGRRLF